MSQSARLAVQGAVLQRWRGVAGQDGVVWGFARGAPAGRRHHPEPRDHRPPRDGNGPNVSYGRAPPSAARQHGRRVETRGPTGLPGLPMSWRPANAGRNSLPRATVTGCVPCHHANDRYDGITCLRAASADGQGAVPDFPRHKRRSGFRKRQRQNSCAAAVWFGSTVRISRQAHVWRAGSAGSRSS
jgi:hypothetical protein